MVTRKPPIVKVEDPVINVERRQIKEKTMALLKEMLNDPDMKDFREDTANGIKEQIIWLESLLYQPQKLVDRLKKQEMLNDLADMEDFREETKTGIRQQIRSYKWEPSIQPKVNIY